jgi:hypothetical protein
MRKPTIKPICINLLKRIERAEHCRSRVNSRENDVSCGLGGASVFPKHRWRVCVSEKEKWNEREEKSKKNALQKRRVVRGILRQRGGTCTIQGVYPLLFKRTRVLVV